MKNNPLTINIKNLLTHKENHKYKNLYISGNIVIFCVMYKASKLNLSIQDSGITQDKKGRS